MEWLDRLCNFSESGDGLLNNAARTEGADHFAAFRSFKFFGKEREVNGQLKTVGVMQCHANYRCDNVLNAQQSSLMDVCLNKHYLLCAHNRSGANGPWHDTHGRHNHDIPIWKDEDLLLDYANFWAPHNRALRDYVANCASDDAIRNFRICLTSSRNRIINTRQPEEAARILHNLQVVFTCHFSIT